MNESDQKLVGELLRKLEEAEEERDEALATVRAMYRKFRVIREHVAEGMEMM